MHDVISHAAWTLCLRWKKLFKDRPRLFCAESIEAGAVELDCSIGALLSRVGRASWKFCPGMTEGVGGPGSGVFGKSARRDGGLFKPLEACCGVPAP